MDQWLVVFVTAAEKENFSRAAEELHMTQPAVSQYIKTLERQTGTQLMERNNKMVRLTKAGEVVYHHAKEIIGLYTRMQHLVDDMMNHTSGPLAIGASYTFGEYILPHVMASLQKKYPFITPTITIHNTRDISDQVGVRELDVGIVEGDVYNEKVHAEAFADDEMVIVGSANHPLAGQDEVVFSDLKDETWIVREEGSGTREVMERTFDGYAFAPKATMTFGSIQVIKEAVEAGLGVSFLSHWTIRKELRLGTLKTLPIKGLPFKRQFLLITQSTSFQTKAVEVFINLLREKVFDLKERD